MKARLLAVLLISTLVLASTAPVASAQVDRNPSVQYVDCSQVQNAFASQYGNANAAAVVDSEATAEVAQKLNISQSQVNACLGNIGQNSDGNGDGDDDGDGNGNGDGDGGNEANNLEDGKDDVLAGTDPGGKLPNTGGPSLLAALAGVALIVGGASLIRFRR